MQFQRTAAEGREELAAALIETDDLDPRWRWSQLEEDRPTIPDTDNSVRVLRELEKSLDGWDPATLKLPDGQQELLKDWPTNQRLDEQRLARIRDALKERENSVALAVSLKDFPRGRAVLQLTPDVMSTLLPHAQNPRSASRLLELDSERLLHAGQVREASLRIHAILHAGASLREEPMVISQLVRMACRRAAVRQMERLLAMAELGDAALTQLSTHFQAELGEDLLLTALRGERAAMHILFENLESGKVPLSDFLACPWDMGSKKPDLMLRCAAILYGSRLFEDHAFTLRTFNEAYAIARLPSDQQLRAWDQWEQRLKTAKATAKADKRLILSMLLTSAVQKVGEAALRGQAQLSCTVAALAAERFRLAQNRWPKTLEELCPTYLPEVPTDPFNGQSLRFASRDDGIVIYSVGTDGHDNGGEILNPPLRKGVNSDLGLRLWNVDSRGRPPSPKSEKQSE